MKGYTGLVGVGVAACLLGGLPTLPAQASAEKTETAKAATVVTADFEMNEPSGATTMIDSSGNGNNGTIDPTGVQTNVAYDGAVGYNWVRRSPTAPPASPERVVVVPDDPALEPGSQEFTIELRYRTKESYGNITQKGQATSRGGQWKIQNPGGMPSCLFQGSDAQVATRSKQDLSDNEWHILTCELTSTGVTMYVDGVRENHKSGTIGTLDNKAPVTIGGKINCDQDTITCDYFSGQIDYLKLYKGARADNQPPTAKFTWLCSGLTCEFDSSTSSDPDGVLDDFAWDFGDGETSTEANPTHTYDTPGTYKVRLVATDADGAKDSAAHTFTVAEGTPPSRPRSVVAEAGDASATVSWLKQSDDGSGTVTGYTVTSVPDGKTCTTTTLTCTVHGLTNGRLYTFTVVTESTAGSSPVSNPSNEVKPAGAPLQAARPKATPAKKSALLTWRDARANGSKVLRYAIVTSKGQHKTVEGNLNKVRFRGLKSDTKYKFRMRAVNAVGAGPWSAWSKVVKVR